MLLLPLDINLAGEPKPHRSKTAKRSAGDMYRCVCVRVCVSETSAVVNIPASSRPYSPSVDLEYDFQRDYYDR